MSDVFHLVAWAVVRRADGRVLLARRSGVQYGDGLWGLPGGHVEDHESLAAAAARETLEEVGLRIDPVAAQAIGVTRYVDDGFRGADWFHLVTSWEGEPSALAECSEVGWHDPADLPADALPWLAHALRVHLVEGRWLDEQLPDEQLPDEQLPDA